jgi:hypothetical protein
MFTLYFSVQRKAGVETVMLVPSSNGISAIDGIDVTSKTGNFRPAIAGLYRA